MPALIICGAGPSQEGNINPYWLYFAVHALRQKPTAHYMQTDWLYFAVQPTEANISQVKPNRV